MKRTCRFILTDLQGQQFALASSSKLRAVVDSLANKPELAAIVHVERDRTSIELKPGPNLNEADLKAFVDTHFSSHKELELFVKDDTASGDNKPTILQFWITKEEWDNAFEGTWPKLKIYDRRSAPNITIELEPHKNPQLNLDTNLDWSTITLLGWIMPKYYHGWRVEHVSIYLAGEVLRQQPSDPNRSGIENLPPSENETKEDLFEVPVERVTWKAVTDVPPDEACDQELQLTLKNDELHGFYKSLIEWSKPVCRARAVIEPPDDIPFRLYEPTKAPLDIAELLNNGGVWCAQVTTNNDREKVLKVKKHLIKVGQRQNIRKLFVFEGVSADDINQANIQLQLSRPWQAHSAKTPVELTPTYNPSDTGPVVKLAFEGSVDPVGAINYTLCIHLHKKRAVSLAVDLGSYSILAGIVDNDDEGEPTLLDFGKQPELGNSLSQEATLQIYKLSDVPRIKGNSVSDRAKFLRGTADQPIRFALLSKDDVAQLGSEGLIHSRIHGFKSRLFAGEKYIEPRPENGSEPIETIAVFKDILCQIIAEVLWTEEAKSLLNTVAIRARNNKQEGTSIGLALAHPGHVSMQVYRRMERAAVEVMTLLHSGNGGVQALPQFEGRDIFTQAYHSGPGAVRGFSEPVAAAVDQLIPRTTKATNLPRAEQSAVCLDIGHRTFDFAAVRKSAQTQSSETSVDKQMGLMEVRRFASADLGGQHLTFLLAAALRNRLCELTTDSQIIAEIKRAVPIDDEDLWRHAESDDQAQRILVRAQQNLLLDALERAKCLHNGQVDTPFAIKLFAPSEGLKPCPPNICKLLQRASQSNDQRFKDFRVSKDGEIFFCPTVKAVLGTKEAERYREAVEAFLDENLSASGNVKIVLAGRGGLSILMLEILKKLKIAVHRPERTKTKLEVLRGTVLLARNFNAVLVDLPFPLIVVWLKNNGKSIVKHEEWHLEANGKQSATMDVTAPADASSMCVVEATTRIMECLQESKEGKEEAEGQALFDWLSARFFLKEALGDTSSHLRVVAKERVSMSITRPSAGLSTGAASEYYIQDDDDMRIGAETISVQAHVVVGNGHPDKSAQWTFIHPGTINQ